MAARASVTTACWEERDPQGGVAQLAESWGAISIEPPATLTPSCCALSVPFALKQRLDATNWSAGLALLSVL